MKNPSCRNHNNILVSFSFTDCKVKYINLDNLKIGTLVRIKPFDTIWKGEWEIRKFYDRKDERDENYILVVRYKKDSKGNQVLRKDGERWKISSRIITKSDVIEILFNPSRRRN